MRLIVAVLLLLPASLGAMWLSPGERAHKAEFFQAWEQRFGPVPSGNPPVALLKTWFRQWKLTGLAPGPWLDANVGQPPPAGGGGAPGGASI